MLVAYALATAGIVLITPPPTASNAPDSKASARNAEEKISGVSNMSLSFMSLYMFLITPSDTCCKNPVSNSAAAPAPIINPPLVNEDVISWFIISLKAVGPEPFGVLPNARIITLVTIPFCCIMFLKPKNSKAAPVVPTKSLI